MTQAADSTGRAGRALTTRRTADEARANLACVLRLCEEGRLRCSEKSRRPGAATVALVTGVLQDGDFYPAHAIAAFAWPLLVQAGRLAELAGTPDSIQDYLVYQLQHVSALDQQWGVWGAGSASQPGNKDGWEYSAGTWITNTVGFAGPGQRYTLAIMYNLRGYGGHSDVGFDYGTNELTQIASLLFQGHYTARPTPLPFAVP